MYAVRKNVRHALYAAKMLALCPFVLCISTADVWAPKPRVAETEESTGGTAGAPVAGVRQSPPANTRDTSKETTQVLKARKEKETDSLSQGSLDPASVIAQHLPFLTDVLSEPSQFDEADNVYHFVSHDHVLSPLEQAINHPNVLIGVLKHLTLADVQNLFCASPYLSRLPGKTGVLMHGSFPLNPFNWQVFCGHPYNSQSIGHSTREALATFLNKQLLRDAFWGTHMLHDMHMRLVCGYVLKNRVQPAQREAYAPLLAAMQDKHFSERWMRQNCGPESVEWLRVWAWIKVMKRWNFHPSVLGLRQEPLEEMGDTINQLREELKRNSVYDWGFTTTVGIELRIFGENHRLNVDSILIPFAGLKEPLGGFTRTRPRLHTALSHELVARPNRFCYSPRVQDGHPVRLPFYDGFAFWQRAVLLSLPTHCWNAFKDLHASWLSKQPPDAPDASLGSLSSVPMQVMQLLRGEGDASVHQYQEIWRTPVPALTPLHHTLQACLEQVMNGNYLYSAFHGCYTKCSACMHVVGQYAARWPASGGFAYPQPQAPDAESSPDGVLPDVILPDVVLPDIVLPGAPKAVEMAQRQDERGHAKAHEKGLKAETPDLGSDYCLARGSVADVLELLAVWECLLATHYCHTDCDTHTLSQKIKDSTLGLRKGVQCSVILSNIVPTVFQELHKPNVRQALFNGAKGAGVYASILRQVKERMVGPLQRIPKEAKAS